MSIAGPSYLALVFDLVGREDLANAIALNSTQFQLARALGPLAAGLGFKIFGLAGCFFANGLSFAAVVIGLAMVKYGDHNRPGMPADRSIKDRRAFVQDLTEGFRYVGRRSRVSMLLAISAVTSLFGAPYISMTPVFVRHSTMLATESRSPDDANSLSVESIVATTLNTELRERSAAHAHQVCQPVDHIRAVVPKMRVRTRSTRRPRVLIG